MLGGTIGLVIGGPLGAIAGGAIGHHLFDKGGVQHGGGQWANQMGRGPTPGTSPVEERQAAFFLALFSILGKLAKADGQITREEGETVVSFLDQMGVQGKQRQFAIRVFNEAKDSPYSAEDFARQFAQLSRMQPDLRSSMLDMLFQVALADGKYHPKEEEMIAAIAAILGIGKAQLDAYHSRYVDTTDTAYAALGLSADADDETVRSTYRKLVHEYHPDRIISQGMPQEFVEYATQRFQEIQTAWDTIRKERNL